jgi:hypothetical protein
MEENRFILVLVPEAEVRPNRKNYRKKCRSLTLGFPPMEGTACEVKSKHENT